jgi:hypothetical protein
MRRVETIQSVKIVNWILENKPCSPRVFSKELKKFEKVSGLRFTGVDVKGKKQITYYKFLIVDRKKYIFFKLKNDI